MPDGFAGPGRLRELLNAVIGVGADLDLHAVLERIVVAVTELAEARYGALGLLSLDTGVLDDVITVGLSEEEQAAIGPLPQGRGIIGHVMRTDETIRIADLTDHPLSFGFPADHPPMRAFLGMPVRADGRVVGTLYLADKLENEVFTDIDQELVELLASAAGVAISNATAHAQVSQDQLVIAAYGDVAAALAAGQPRDEVLQLLARRARQLVDGDFAVFAIPHPDGGLVTPVADGADADSYRGARFPSEGSIALRVMATGAPIVLDDLSADPVGQGGARGGRLGASIHVPLIDEGPVGCLTVCRMWGRPAFRSAEVQLVSTLAAQAGMVLADARRRDLVTRLRRSDDPFRTARALRNDVLPHLLVNKQRLESVLEVVSDPPTHDALQSCQRDLTEALRQVLRITDDLTEPTPSS